MTVRIAFESAVRTAACDLLRDYATSVGLKLQVYRGRPATVFAPSAFVDRMTGTIAYPGSVTWRERTTKAELLVLHGLFDSGEAVDQRDMFVDSFLDFVTDRVHEAGDNTTLGLIAVEDEPDYVPEWVVPEKQRTYYATRLTLEGYAGG